MKVFGFNAVIVREPGMGYAARIKELHANTQGRTMKELDYNLRDVAKMMILDVLENENRYSKSTVERARSAVMEALA